jgi:hypothetical protein
MNLLDKYIIEIGKKLPRKNRLDLQTEIRSTIEDMLEDRSRSAKRPIDNQMIEDILAEYGSPAKVAAAYHTTHYVIGPQLYPFFILVVKIVLGVLLAVTLAGFLWNYYTNPVGPGFMKALGQFALQFFGGATAALGNIGLIFAILERVLPASEFDETKEEWKPSDLNAEPDPDKVSRGEMIFSILFTFLGLMVLNFVPELIGYAYRSDNSWMYVPALSDAFFRYLPWINILGVTSILLYVFLLRQGFWQALTRIVNLIVEVAGIVLAGVMLTGPSLIKFSVADLASTPVAGSADILVQLVQLAPRIILVILIVTQSVEAVQTILKMVQRRQGAVWVFPKK